MNEDVQRFLRHPAVAPAFVGAACFTVGYLLGKRNRIVARTVPVMTDDRDEQEFSEENFIPTEDLEIRVMSHPSEIIETMVNEEGDGLTIFETPVDGAWDWETENLARTTLEPYVLHKDEFYGEEKEGYTQTTLTYYAGDDILVDENDRPIYNHIAVIGPMRFGHGSDQLSVFYVRNDSLKAEYEVVLDEGLYSVEVLGLEIEEEAEAKDLKHSVPRFRME